VDGELDNIEQRLRGGRFFRSVNDKTPTPALKVFANAAHRKSPSPSPGRTKPELTSRARAAIQSFQSGLDHLKKVSRLLNQKDSRQPAD
jgi:hypothetical protein